MHLDPELEVTNTIGSKEGFSHLMWVLLERGDAAIVPTPSYPIHMYGPLFAGADLRQLPMRGLSHPDERANFSEEFFDNLHRAYDIGWPKPRVLVISFLITRPGRASILPSCSESSTFVVNEK